jgi:hypothetical protein
MFICSINGAREILSQNQKSICEKTGAALKRQPPLVRSLIGSGCVNQFQHRHENGENDTTDYDTHEYDNDRFDD